ncbi:MAG: pyruvate kinase alpha/beta domain-containing protein, partial [Halobacteria archaeon]|nr:pyruvate kinase alpha/beta domain-containing protein [Halobacteria archaeon]
ARDVGATAVIAASESGYTALKTAKFRPSVPIVATTPNDYVRRRLTLSWGVHAQLTGYIKEGADAVIENAVQEALDSGIAESGDTVVVMSGRMTELEEASTTNMLKIHVAAETVATGQGVVSGRASGPIGRTRTGNIDNLPEGAILVLSSEFEEEFKGDMNKIAGIVTEKTGMTDYSAVVARELGVPMVSGASLDTDTVDDGEIITIDGERGVVYRGDIIRRETK